MAQFLWGEDLQTVVYRDDDLRYQKAKYSKPIESAKFIDVASGFVSCEVQTDVSLYCWGWGHRNPFKEPGRSFTMVGRVGDSACALEIDGSTVCWSYKERMDPNYKRNLTEVPPGPFTTLAAGLRNTCGPRSNGALVCWGNSVR